MMNLNAMSTLELLEEHAELSLGMAECEKRSERDYGIVLHPSSSIEQMKAALADMESWDQQTAWARDAMTRIHTELTRRQLDERLKRMEGLA